MPSSLNPIEKNMRLPVLPDGSCINHPDRKIHKKHLCAECYAKWEASLLKFEVDKEADRDFENDKENWFNLGGNSQ